MRRDIRQSVGGLGSTVDLALISFAALYFEMIAIRWLASDVRVFAYLKNLPLLAAFLGLGLGCALAARPPRPPNTGGSGPARVTYAGGGGLPRAAEAAGGRPPQDWERSGGLRAFPLLCLVFAGVVAFAGPLDLVHLYFPQDDLWVWNDANWQTQTLPTALLIARFFGVVLALFFLVVALFASLGARLGVLFDALPPTRAYSVNLLASLAGIWAFGALAWLGWPPLGWFALGVLVLLRFFAPRRAPRLPSPPGQRSGRREAASVPPPGREAARSSARGAGAGWRGLLGSAVAVALLGATLVVVAVAPGATRWSPYYRIDLSPYVLPGPGGPGAPSGALEPVAPPASSPGSGGQGGASAPGGSLAGYHLTVNHDYHQKALNLSDGFVRAHPGSDLETARVAYDLPYRFAQPRRVLVVGAGMGNDVAAALRHGAQRVDAVEIDPAILDLGRELHPERPYGSPRVRLINDDARAYLARSEEQYDLIVFGLLDSHTLLSSMSSLRLDSYVYTLESLEQARAHLAPGGHLALAFAASVGGWDWLAARLYQMVTAAFGAEPVALTLGYDVSTLYMVGPGVRERLAADPTLAALAVDPAPLRAPVQPATDDWPFLYLRERGVPLMPYGLMLAILLGVGGGLVLLTLRGVPDTARTGSEPARPPAAGFQSPVPGLDVPMFLLGAAFMLLETKSISQLALLFGSTWLVTALIITAILVLALLANLFVAWWRPTHVGPAYALLAGALLADYLLPLGALGGQDAVVRAALGSLLLALPLLFAGVVFATLFARTAAPSRAFGSNLLGALAGGLLEYASMATGFKALGLLALALYAASWLVLRRRPLLAQARRVRTWRRARVTRVVRT